MAFGNIEMTIANESRPCVFILRETGECRGLFHGWFVESRIVPPSNLRGGHPGGAVQEVIALVEDINGDMHKISPKHITFIDGKVERIFEEGCYVKTPGECADLQSGE